MSGFVAEVRILIDFGVAGHINAGIYDRCFETGLLTRSAYFDEASEIQKNSIFQVKAGGALAGSQFMVVTPDEPVVGADAIGFENITEVILGRGTVAKDRLRPEFVDEFEGLPRQLAPMSIIVPADSSVDLVHNLVLGAEPYITDSLGNNLSDSFLVSHPSAGVTRLASLADSDVPVSVTFTGVRI